MAGARDPLLLAGQPAREPKEPTFCGSFCGLLVLLGMLRILYESVASVAKHRDVVEIYFHHEAVNDLSAPCSISSCTPSQPLRHSLT